MNIEITDVEQIALIEALHTDMSRLAGVKRRYPNHAAVQASADRCIKVAEDLLAKVGHAK